MRILLVYYNYPQLSATYVEAEIQYMLRQGIEVEIWSETDPGAAYEPSCIVHRGSLREAEERFKPDIVHFYWLKLAERLLSEISCVHVTVRSHSFEAEVDVAHRLSQDPRAKALFMFPDQAAQVGSLHNMIVLPVAYDTRLFSNSSLSPKNSKLVVCTTAGLPAKSLEDFFVTAKRCRELDFILVVATCSGHSSLIHECRRLSRDPNSNVELRIDFPHSEVPSLLAEAALYFCTQKAVKRGMPIAIAEALACGCFVLVPEFPWLVDMVGPYGVGYSDSEDAASKLQLAQSWSRDRWQRLAVGSSEFSRERYGDELVLPKMVGAWRSLLS